MSTYRLLQDHFIAGQVLSVGTIQSTADVGGLLPTNWIPTPNVDPLDTAAVIAFYAAGPALMDRVQSPSAGVQNLPLGNVFLPPPVTYWKMTPSNLAPWTKEFSSEFGSNQTPPQWTLTGLGILFPPVSM